MTDHKLMQEPNLWIPMIHDPIGLAILGKWSEELGELVSAIARCGIQGIDENHPVTAKPNQDWLQEEIADVVAMFRLAQEHFDLQIDPARIEAKMGHKRRWLDKIRVRLAEIGFVPVKP